MAIIISKGGKNAARVDPSDFTKEGDLQQYILDNPESIPLYEIKKDIPLLILAREFPTDSGPIDALGVDKYGEIYLVETKLYKNPDKRTVVAQVLDYGASLWRSSIDFSEFLHVLEEEVQKKWNMSLHEKLEDYFNADAEDLLEHVRQNLNDGNFKFVVLMDKLRDELKNLIIFLNQNSKFDIYAVELEYYKHEAYEIMIPKLFGAEVKKDIGVSSGERKEWDEVTFFEDARARLDEKGLEAVKKIYEFSKKHAGDLRFGTGVTRGSFSPRFTEICSKSIFTITAKGKLEINFDWMHENERVEKIRDIYKEELEKIGLKLPTDYRDRKPGFQLNEWLPLIDKFIGVIENLIAAARNQMSAPQ